MRLEKLAKSNYDPEVDKYQTLLAKHAKEDLWFELTPDNLHMVQATTWFVIRKLQFHCRVIYNKTIRVILDNIYKIICKE